MCPRRQSVHSWRHFRTRVIYIVRHFGPACFLLLDQCNLLIPPYYGLSENVASIIAFP